MADSHDDDAAQLPEHKAAEQQEVEHDSSVDSPSPQQHQRTTRHARQAPKRNDRAEGSATSGASDDDSRSSSSSSYALTPHADLSSATASVAPTERLLYDVFFHAPHLQPDASEYAEDGAASPGGGGSSAAAPLDDVSEVEYLSAQRDRVSSLTVQAARKQMHRVWHCCRRQKAMARKEDDLCAEALSAAPSAGDDDESPVHANWPLLLSPNGDLLAIVKERSVVVRGSNHDFAFQQLEFPIPPYPHLASPYPASLAQLAAITLPNATAPAAHPFSQSHSRPCAWSMRSELLAVVARQDEVCVYSLAPLRLVHTLRISATSPLEAAAATSALTLPIQSRRRAQFPSIASLAFREAVCPQTPRGYCPHLIVLCYDGSIHHLHLPAVGMASEGISSSLPPPSPFIGAAGASAAVAAPSQAALYPPHIPLAHTSRSSSDDARSSSRVPEEQQLRQRGAGATAAESEAKSPDSAAKLDAALSREYVTFLGAPAVHHSTAVAPVAFGSASYDAAHQLLFVASISLSRERTPLVSVWRVSDTESPFLFHVVSTPYESAAVPKPVVRQSRTLSRLLAFAKMSVGLASIGGGADSAQEQEEQAFVPTLADVACSLHVSPDGSRVALLDQRGNLNVWLCRMDESPPSCALLDSHRAHDGCPSVPKPSDGNSGPPRSAVLLCDVSWWSPELLLCAYTNGHLLLTPLNLPSMLSARATPASSALTAPSMHELHRSSGESLRRNLLGDRAEGVHGIPVLSRALEARTKDLSLVSRSSRNAESRSGSPSLAPASSAGNTVQLPHRVFLLECERRFLRRRKVWSSVGALDDEESAVSFEAGVGSVAADEQAPIQLRRTFRLLSLCQSTPEEFLLAKVAAHQWDEALLLARTYDLNTDLVYQTRWRASPVTPHAVQAFLAPVRDQWWVLQQLVERLYDVRGDTEAAMMLLTCGLDFTTPERIERIREQHETDRKIKSSRGSGAASSFERDQTKLCLYRLLFLHYLDRVRSLRLLHRVAPPSASLSRLSLELFLDCDLVAAAVLLAEDEQFVALQLLCHAHQEDLWPFMREIIAAIPDTTDPSAYIHLLPMPGTSFAAFAARRDEATALVQDDAAAIAAETGDADSPPTQQLQPLRRDRDWVENAQLLESMLQLCRQQAQPLQSPFELDALQAKLQTLTLLDAGQLDLSDSEVRDWYAQRVVDIDARSGQLSFAQQLLQYAQQELHVAGLEAEEHMLADLTQLVYTYKLESLSLREYAPLDDFARLCLVLRATTPNTVVHDLSTKASMFFARSQQQQLQQGDSSDPDDPFILSPATPPLLRRYMLHIAPSRLDLIYAIVLASKPSSGNSAGAISGAPLSSPHPSTRLIPNHADLISLSVECCYGASSSSDPSPPDADTLQLLTQIFECLPARSHSDSSRMQRLHRYLDELDAHLTAIEILTRYGHGRPLHFFLTLPPSTPEAQELLRWGPARAAIVQQQEEEQRWARKHPSLKRKSAPPVRVEAQCVQLLERVARSGLKRSPPLSDAGWHALLRDMLELRLKVFPFVAPSQIHAMVLHCTLSREKWALSRELLRSLTSSSAAQGESPLMPLAEAERLVLDVAREMLNSAPSLSHHALAQAQACLDILPIHEHTHAPSRLERADSEDSNNGGVSSVASNQLSTPDLSAEWQAEFELLAGLGRLEKMGITSLVPLEIRLVMDRQKKAEREQLAKRRLRDVLDDGTDESGPSPAAAASSTPSNVLDLLLRSNPHVYTHGSDVLDVLRSLGFNSDSMQTAGKLQLAEAALEHQDFHTCLKMLLSLMEHSPPTQAQQRERASQLCYKLSQQLNFPAPNAFSAAGAAGKGVLLKPKLHLLAHTLWSCEDEQALSTFLREYQDLSLRQLSETQAQQAARRSPPVEDEEAQDEDAETPSPQASPETSPAAAELVDDDADSQTDVERLIASAFAGGDSQRAIRPPDLLTVAHAHQVGESAPAIDPSESNSGVDAALLQLIARTCGTDSALALSYLLSLSDPFLAQPVLDARLEGRSSSSVASADSSVPSIVAHLPPLTRAQRQECVELAMRFFASVCLLQPQPPHILEAIQRVLADAAAAQAASSGHPAPGPLASPTPLREWEIPSAPLLLECPLDGLQSYLDTLQAAYDASATPAADSSSSVASSSSPSLPRALSLALHYNSLRVEAKKSEFMLLHCPSIDVGRFTSDAKYRIDSVRRMARGDVMDEEEGASSSSADGSALSGDKMFELALLLCKRYHLDSWEVYMERVRSLFLRSESVSDIREGMEGFKSDQLLSSRPVSTYTALIESVWPSIPGTDLPRIALLVDLCLECFASIMSAFQAASSTFTSPQKKKSLILFERNKQRLTEHKELIEKLMHIQNMQSQSSVGGAVADALDYKQLISSPASCMRELRKLLTEHNIFLVSRLCSKIQHLIACSQAAQQAGAAGGIEGDSGAAVASLNVGLFPVLKAGAPESSANLADILYDVPAPSAAATAASSSSEDDASNVRIDSSLLFMLFLSHALRKHMDSLRRPGAAAGSSSAALPTVTAWFAHFDSLLKRLSVPHFVQLICESALAEAEGFSVHPIKAELRNRLEVTQCGLRVLEQLPAWLGPAASAAAASAVGGAGVPGSQGLHRSLSTDLDANAPALSADAKALLYDQLADAHLCLCILAAMHDVGSLNDNEMWPQLVRTRARGEELYALLLQAISRASRDGIPAADFKRILDKIRVQKESVEFRSARAQERAAAEEQSFVWELFPMLQSCVREQLQPERYYFDPELMSPEASPFLATLRNAAAMCRSAAASGSQPSDLAALLSTFSSQLSEERNVAIFQQLLQFVTTAPHEVDANMDAKQQTQHVQTQMRVLISLQELRHAQRGAALHATLQEQLVGSQPLRTSLLRSLHVHLLLLRAALLSAPSAAVPGAALAKMAASLEMPRTRTTALEKVFALFDAQAREDATGALSVSLAAVLLLLTDAKAPLGPEWPAFLQQLVQRHQTQLLFRVVDAPLTSSTAAAAASNASASIPSTTVVSLLDVDAARTVYRALLAQADGMWIPLQFALRFDSSRSPLPQQGVQHLLRFLTLQGPARSNALTIDAPVIDLLLRHASLCIVPLLPHASLFRAIAAQLVHQWRSLSALDRRASVGPGSLPHVLALLVAEQHYAQAIAIYHEAHATSTLLSSRGRSATPTQLLKSFLQQAKTELHAGGAAHARLQPAEADALLNEYRAALSTLLMDDFGQ